MKKLVSGIVLILLLMAMSSLTLNIKSTKAEWTGTVYIRADGNIDPPDAPIITHDNVTYTLTNNITCSVNGVIIERNDIVFDGNGFTILGPSREFGIVWYGMIIENVNNVSIVNVTVTNFFIGIYFNNSSHNKILECSIINNARGIEFDSYSMFNMVHKSVVRGNSQYGIIVGEDGSNNNVISENFIEDNFQGVWLDTSNNSILKNTIANNYFEGIRLNGDNNNVFENTILYHYYPGILVMGSHNLVCNNTLNASIQIYSSLNNTVSGNHVTDFGIFLSYSSYNTLRNNSMDNFEIIGTKLEHFINDIDVSNIIKGKPIYYFVNRNNESIVVKEAECGYFALINSTNIDLKVLGVNTVLAFIQNCTITESNARFEVISSSRCAFSRSKGVISMEESSDNYVFENNLTGLYLYYSAFNRVYANVIYYPIQLYRSSNNNITRNKVCGIQLSGSNNYIIENDLECIDLYGSSNNIIRGNNITNNYIGIYLEDSSNNSIIGNYIANQIYGISVYNSSNNSIYHNAFINNHYHVFDWSWLVPSELPPSLNTWDDGYPSGGNYWSDYAGVDLYSGPYQNETGSDGIGDTPYFIGANNVDKYPLMSPWSPISLKIFDVVCEGTHYSVSVQSNSTVTHFIFNQALAQISFNVSGTSGTWGFCNITIPKALMTGPWTYTFQGDVTNMTYMKKIMKHIHS